MMISTPILALFLILSPALQGVHPDMSALDKLRSSDWEIWPDAAYDLALMGEDAVPFLLNVLTDESRDARWHAVAFLGSYGDKRALPGLTRVFLNDRDEYVRFQAALALANTDVRYTAELMAGQLEKPKDPVAQDIAVSILSKIGDRRVIPTLVRRLENPATRKEAAFALARFKDERAAPALIEMLRVRDWRDQSETDLAERAVKALAQIGDRSAIPILVRMLKSPLGDEMAKILPDFGSAVVPPLLEMLRQTTSYRIRDRVIRALEHIHDPLLAPIYGRIFLETEDWALRRPMAEALANMGAAGIEYLLKGAKLKNRHRIALQQLSTYNDKKVADAVAELALDKSNPFRLAAIRTLRSFWPMWGAELMPTAMKLLHDPNPEVRLYVIRIFRDQEVREAAEALSEVAHNDPDALVRRAASSVLASFSGISPLKLEIEMNRSRYRYGQQVYMKFRIINVWSDDVTVCTQGISTQRIFHDMILKPEIRKPDGTLKYSGSRYKLAFPRRKDFKTLKPGDELSGYIDISKFYRPYQPGRYTAKLSYRSVHDGVQYGLWGWVGVLESQEVSFEIDPPSVKRLRELIAEIDIERINRGNARKRRYRWEKALDICYQLGEIGDPAAIEALKSLAFLGPRSSGEERFLIDRVRIEALKALAKFPLHELTPMWIRLLKDRSLQEIAMNALIKISDPEAIEPLRHLVFSGSDNPVRVALALKELGDDKGIEWLKALAMRKLKHWDPNERRNGIWTLGQIRQSEGIRDALADEDPEVREAARYWLKTVAEDIGVGGIKAMLNDPNPNVRKAIAYQLALLGDPEGLNLIEEDLYAEDKGTRGYARYAFLTARGLKSWW
jgi:HEAT repeat protein